MHIPFIRTTVAARTVAVVDIGSSSAGAVILDCTGNNAAVRATARVALPLADRTQKQLHTGVVSALSEALTRALAEARKGDAHVAIREVFAIVHAPWVASNVAVQKAEFESDTKITAALVRDLAQKAMAASRSTGDKKATQIESFLMRVELNGYPVAQPEGKRAKSIAVSVLVSSSDPAFTDSVRETVAAQVPDAKLLWRSASRALLRVLRENDGMPAAYLIADVQDEATDFAIVEDGIIRSLTTSSVGQRQMLAEIAPKGMPEDTLASVRHVCVDDCEDDACQTFRESMGKAEGELARRYGEALGKELPHSRLPNTIVLLAHPDLRVWLERFFTRIDFSQFTTTMQPFSAMALPDTSFAKLAGLESPALDTDLKIAAALVAAETCR